MILKMNNLFWVILLNPQCYILIFLRGGWPEHIYFPLDLPGRKLGGPRPGKLFDMRGNSPLPEPHGDTGNMSKGKWMSEDEMKKFATILQLYLKKFVLDEGLANVEFITSSL